MSVGLVLSAFEGDAVEASAETEIPLTVARTLASTRFLARLPAGVAGDFLRCHDARAYARRAKPRAPVPATVVTAALGGVEAILAEERALDILVCEDARTGRELAQVRFLATPTSYARTQSYDTREFAQAELSRIVTLPAGVGEAHDARDHDPRRVHCEARDDALRDPRRGARAPGRGGTPRSTSVCSRGTPRAARRSCRARRTSAACAPMPRGRS